MPYLAKHIPPYSFPCKECMHLSQDHKGEGCDFCTLLEIWIHPDLAKEITCNARTEKKGVEISILKEILEYPCFGTYGTKTKCISCRLKTECSIFSEFERNTTKRELVKAE